MKDFLRFHDFSLIYATKKSLLSTYYVPGILLGPGDAAVNMGSRSREISLSL